MTRTIGAYLFPGVWQDWSRDEAERMLKTYQDFGVNTIVTEAESYRDDLIELAHKLGLRFVGATSCFSEHNHPERLEQQPELWPILETGERRPLMEWYIGVTPTIESYREERLNTIERLVRAHDFDAFCLDFIRWPLHWEIELRPGQPEPPQSSFDPHTVRGFLEYVQLEMPSECISVAEQARWILTEHKPAWTDFKCQVITSFVSAARERLRAARGDQLPMGVYLVPAPDDERAYLVGQRARDLAAVADFFTPMVYHPIVHQTPAWVAANIDELTQIAPGRVLPVLLVDSAEGTAAGLDWGPAMPVAEWQQVVNETLGRRDAMGLVAFTGVALFPDGRGDVLADCVAANPV